MLTLVFQHGCGASLPGTQAGAGITSWLPLLLFVVLFGLSMDYHLFILSRIREAVLGGAPTEIAVAEAINGGGGDQVDRRRLTSAAAVTIAAFSGFARLGSIEFKQIGVGLAAAILIDATLVRAVLLPATMKLLGECNGCLPPGSWLPKPGAGLGTAGVSDEGCDGGRRAAGSRARPAQDSLLRDLRSAAWRLRSTCAASAVADCRARRSSTVSFGGRGW